jgi:hypothetical protein
MTAPRKQTPLTLPPISKDALERADEIMRRMLNTPPAPFTPKKGVKKKPK